MANLQDKICDVLTLAGLLGVVGWGMFSLLSEQEDKPATESVSEEVQEPVQALPVDTLEEVPLIEDHPVVIEVDDTMSVDSLGLHPVDSMQQSVPVSAVPSDSVRHPVVPNDELHHTDTAVHVIP